MRAGVPVGTHESPAEATSPRIPGDSPEAEMLVQDRRGHALLDDALSVGPAIVVAVSPMQNWLSR